MKQFVGIFCAVLMVVALQVRASVPEHLMLMPWPQSVEQQEGFLALGATLTWQLEGSESPRIEKAVQRFSARLARQSTAPVKLQAFRKSRQQPQPLLHIRVASDQADKNFTAPGLDESYTLAVSHAQITISAVTSLGALHALETLSQLVSPTDNQLIIPAVIIRDAPRFIWRGALIDVARHFLPLETLKRQLDAMAAAKLNVFHWHLTDDQGWRLASERFPLLQQKASGGQFYTRDQVREIIAYAWDRGIHVLPEIDMPGHVSALALAYPALMSAPGPYQPEERWGVHKPLLNPASEEVYRFVSELLKETAALFPFEYLHIGGDEVDPEHWYNNPEIVDFMQQHQLADAAALHAYFNQRVEKILAGMDKKMIGWDEILHEDLSRNIVIQSWQGQDALGEAVKRGFKGILSTGFYLDQPQTAGFHYRNEPVPQAMAMDQNIHPDESWQSWQMSLPRKRGAPVEAVFTLIQNPAGDWRGYIDFKGKARRELNQVRFVHNTLRFSLDTWMGPLSAHLQVDRKNPGGFVRVGNAPYVAALQQVAGSDKVGTRPPAGTLPVAVGSEDAARILGGELALWAEMVNESVIDLRLWPRGFVVAERLWSAKEKRDEDHLYHRLQVISDWSAEVVGLQHRRQQEEGIRQWLGIADIQPLLVLSQALEPAHYYHRHHEKSAHGFYSRRDPLNLLADTLPAESLTVYQLQRAVDYWLHHPDDTDAEKVIRSLLESWVANYPAVMATADEQQTLVRELAQQVQMISRLGLYLLDRLAQQKPLSQGEAREAQAILVEAMKMREEVVVAVVFPVESLLDAAR